MTPISTDTLQEILRHIQNNGSMPKELPGVEEEELHNHFTHLWNNGFIDGFKAVTTGMDKIVRDVVKPQLTQKGLKFI
jgi:ribosomal protein S8